MFDLSFRRRAASQRRTDHGLLDLCLLSRLPLILAGSEMDGSKVSSVRWNDSVAMVNGRSMCIYNMMHVVMPQFGDFGVTKRSSGYCLRGEL